MSQIIIKHKIRSLTRILSGFFIVLDPAFLKIVEKR